MRVAMKKLLLSMTVLVASFVANESAVINAPFLKLAEELDDLKSIANSFIERQETPGGLTCASCANQPSVAACNSAQSSVMCQANEDTCVQIVTTNIGGVVSVGRSCVQLSVFAGICQILNASGQIQSCSTLFCNTNLCNAGTPVPSPTPFQCGGPLSGQSGSFTSPNFPNSYPPNVTCTFTISGVSSGSQLLLQFVNPFDLGPGDTLVVQIGGTTVLTIPSGMGKRKRSLDHKQPYEDLFGEYASDYHDNQDYKDYYYYDGRKKEEPYYYEKHKRQVVLFTETITGNGGVISIVFTSNGMGSNIGFNATFTIQPGTDVDTDVDTDNGGNSGTGGNSSESGGGSSDEEQI